MQRPGQQHRPARTTSPASMARPAPASRSASARGDRAAQREGRDLELSGRQVGLHGQRRSERAGDLDAVDAAKARSACRGRVREGGPALVLYCVPARPRSQVSRLYPDYACSDAPCGLRDWRRRCRTENATGYLPGDPRYGLQGEALKDYYRTKAAQWAIYCWDKREATPSDGSRREPRALLRSRRATSKASASASSAMAISCPTTAATRSARRSSCSSTTARRRTSSSPTSR